MQLVWDERLVAVLRNTKLLYLIHFPGHIGHIDFFSVGHGFVLFYDEQFFAIQLQLYEMMYLLVNLLIVLSI